MLQQFGGRDPHDSTAPETFPQKTIAECFEQINSRQVDYAVIPLENSTNGQVVFTYDLLRDWFLGQEAKFRVVAEQFVAVHHYLFSNTLLNCVERLYSHPQVWGQVTGFLAQEKFSGHVTRVDTALTAQAAEMVLKDSSNTLACISSEAGGAMYGLPVRAAQIEDVKGNTTRFLVLGYPEESQSPGNETESRQKLSLLMLVLNRDDPGALCTALDCFRRHHVNLAAITSRPSKITPWQPVFFVETWGAWAQIIESLEALQQCCQEVVYMGLFLRSEQ